MTTASTTRPRPQSVAPGTTSKGFATSSGRTWRNFRKPQREIIHDTHIEEPSSAEIAIRRGITLQASDNYRKAVCGTLRDSMTAVVDCCTDADFPYWYDRIDGMSERPAARIRLGAFRKKVKRPGSGGESFNFQGDGTNFERDRSSFEGDRANSRGDAEKIERARDLSVVFRTESRGVRD